MTGRATSLSAAACLISMLAMGCGSSGETTSAGLEVGQVRAGSVAQLAQCHDWNEGTRAQRIATIHDIRAQLNQAGGLEPTSDIGDRHAYQLLQRACSNEFASGFRLYKLYARGAAFSKLGFRPGGGGHGAAGSPKG